MFDMFNLLCFIEQMMECSRSEARRLIKQGSVKVNNVKSTEPYQKEVPLYIQIGKDKFYQIQGNTAYQLHKKPQTH